MTEFPSALLHRSAEKMRELAENALKSASGRWYVRTPQGGYPQSIADNASAILVADTYDGPGHDQSTAPFIAAMDPRLALLIADWWDAIADDMGDDEVVERGVAGIGVLVLGRLFTPRKPWTAAVAAARAFLAEAVGVDA